MTFHRHQVQLLRTRLKERPFFITIVAGPRQVGKTTLVRQALETYAHYFVAVDQPISNPMAMGDFDMPSEATSSHDGIARDSAWLVRTWQAARQKCNMQAATGQEKAFIFIIDEIQKIPRWSETVKGLWDADRAENLNMHVVLLGSSPILIQKGLTESLAGRYELMPTTHWSYAEMHEAFDFSLDEYIYFGGYPGAAQFIKDEARWRNYVLSSLVRPIIDKDILEMTRVDKPALLKQLFELGSSYSGQILSLKKIKGQLDDAGNETTLAGYLELLGDAGMLKGLHKYHIGIARRRASPPKFNVLNTALMSSAMPYTFAQALADRSYWGRLVESAVGAHLINTASMGETVGYWRESPHEVDFVLSDALHLTAIEVKSNANSGPLKGLSEFQKQHANSATLLVGATGVGLPEFLSYPSSHWLSSSNA